MELRVIDVIESDIALSPETGNSLYLQIKSGIKNKESVTLDFANVKILSTAFLNSAIGRLYSDFNSDELNSSLKIINIESGDRSLLVKVIKRAKEYFSDKDSFNKKIEDRYNQ